MNANNSTTATAFSNLAVLARSKMLSVFATGARADSSGLHRWVLLKNSLVLNEPASAHAPSSLSGHDGAISPSAQNIAPSADAEYDEEPEEDVFTFPTLGAGDDARASEANWLDSLLETLGDDDDDEDEQEDEADVDPSTSLSYEDDDGQPLTPLQSPASSSDDLASPPPTRRPPPITMPYPVPYPPLVLSFGLDAAPSVQLGPLSPTLDDALPYPFFDDENTEDMLVPDAIEDMSDDESDAPMTPSIVSTLSLVRRSAEHTQTVRAGPRIFVETDDPAQLFRSDPLPFAEEQHNLGMVPFGYQEC